MHSRVGRREWSGMGCSTTTPHRHLANAANAVSSPTECLSVAAVCGSSVVVARGALRGV